MALSISRGDFALRLRPNDRARSLRWSDSDGLGWFDLPATPAETVGLVVAVVKESEFVLQDEKKWGHMNVPLAEAGGTLRCSRVSVTKSQLQRCVIAP